MEALEDRTLLTIFVVDTVNELSLRQAIRDANANPGLDFIHFNIPGDGVQTIRPTFGLPDITDPVIINATTQPGWTPNTPMIALDGSLAGDTNGLEFRVGGNTVQGLVIHSFKFDAIVLVEPGSQSPSGGNTIQFNFLGTDATGTVAKPNRIGLHLVGSPNNVIKQNLISGNSFDGIEMDFAESSGNVVQGNNIGGDVTGLNALGNGLNGIFLGAPDVPFLREHPESDVTYASGNLIGGLDLDLGNAEPLGNLIVGNAHAGVYIFRGGENQVQGNYIGVAGNGAIAIPNGTAGTNAEFGADGVFIEEGHDNEIGGVEPGAGNVISANVGAGVRISAVRRAASENVIQGNRIGTDGSGHFQEGLGNQTNGIEITNTTNDISGEVSAINFIGGDDELDGEQDGAVGARNIISGNGRDGILVAGHFLETVIQGNYIGVDIDGLIAAPNGRDGIRLTAFAGQDAESSVTIIGSLDPERHETGNLISGNVADGIFIGFGAKAQVFRNAIGINKDGSDGLGNGRNGLTINDSSGNRIGGQTTFEDQPVSLGNIISANVVDGVTIGGGSRDNHLIGNLIGVDKDQGDKLGNGRHGVSIFDSPSNHIGDATAAGRNVIVNSKQFGVLISGVDSRLNTLTDNYIGVNLDGTTPRGNQTAGVVLLDATDNTIGGTAGERNLISANQGPGVQIENGNLNKVLGNSIGSDSIGEFREDLGNFTSGVVILNSADNTVRDNQIRGNGVLIGSGIAIGGPGATGNKVEANDITHNSLRGVNIFNAASDNYIGGADTDARNVISANPDGVFIEDGAHDNHVVLNLIGTDESGAVAEGFGNTQSGIGIVGAHSNEVRGNSIRGNATGILISGDSSRDNTVRGNRITNNAEQGVEITAGAIHNTVGGLLEQERNLISKNKEGVRIESLARDNVVTENFIGTDETGAFNSETGNSVAGVVIRDAHENQIAGNTIRGNVVGVSISGADAKRNLIDENVITHSALRGIHLLDGAADNSIGLVLGNLISANADGVVIAGSAHDNRVNGNRIGTNEAGAFQEGFGNTDNGIVIFDGRLNTVQRNIVRGSGGGIGIVGGDGNIIRDNTITNNRDEGILLSAGAFNNLIGGRNGGSSNIITNNGAGVRVEVSSHHNEIIDNRIGTDASGEINAALGNTGPGLSILDAHHTIVESNVIRSNRTGISISGAAANFNAVRDNIITHSTEHGVHILDGASDNPIGGLGAEDFNRISENLKSGVVVESGVNNAVLRNRIFGNFSLGIDLGDNGVSLNEKLKDTDAGPNNLQNFPELAFATVGGSRRIVGTLSSTPATLFVLEFFATMQADSSGFGEAERFVTTTAVTTNASGVASFDLFLPEGEVAGTSLTVTATDPNGNTSEFAKTIRIETDTDGDGVPDRLESDAPNSGDGNQDGIPDSQQPGVASFLSAATSSYVTLALPASAPAGASLSGVRPLSNPSPDDAPSEASFGLGFFDFRITGLAPGAAVAVEQFLPSGMTPISYFRYGPLPGQAAPQWYNWVFDGTTGAVINGNRVKLNFVDGLRGDDDLLVNGTIVDPGGPGYNRALMVTNTLDSGPGSLRQAILDANSRPGFDFIDFAIGSGGPAIISPLSDLPIITDPVFIDGRSQDGFAGSPIIELNGQSDALGTGLTVRAFDTTIRGLVINRFALAGISVTPPGNNSQNNVVIVGNFIGTDITGRLARPNGNGIIVNGGAFHRIGGTTPEGRNVISGNAFDGIVLNGGFGMQLQGNHIGAAADGISPLGNGDNGIRIPNVFTAPFNLTIGGSISSAGNTIAFNGDSGILDLAPNRNIGFLSNSIYSNGLLGISRDPNGKVVLNDIGTSDTGGTNVQNFPVLFSAQSSGGQTAISGYLNSRRNSAYSLQFFSNATIDLTGFGEGQTLIGSTSVTTDANGHVDFTVNLPVALTNGVSITATVTDSSNNTSEFSRRVGVGEVVTNVIIVNSTDDVDDGVADATHTSLREAIHAANNFPGSNEIHFAIGSGVRTINVLTPLPAIVEAVTIDGTTQPGFTGSPIIELDGSSRVTKGFVGFPTTEFNDSSGLAVNASNTTIRGLVINRFAVSVLASLKTNPPSQLLVQQPFAAPGIDVYSIGAEVSFGGVIIEGNYIGTDVTGMLPRPNSGGIHIRGGNNHRVGGTTPAQRNVISGNMGNGIDIHIGDSHLVQGNFIGVGADGIMPLGNTTPDLVVDSRIVAYSSWGNGIAINTAGTGNVTHTTIGGLQAGAGNLIAFNGRDGISTGLPFAGNPILSNSIHSNRLLGISFGSHQVVLNEQTLLFDAAGRIVKYPVIHSAESASGQTTIAGHFDGAANANFLIQFFSSATVDASGFGEGETFIGSTSVTTNASGHVDFTATLPVAVANRRLLTATATDAAGSTSQFSRRQAVGEVHTGIFIVNTTDDVDDGTADATHTSLREAIHAANNNPGSDEIRFAIGSGIQTITPLTPLPVIVDSTVIDGWTQPGFAGTPIIELSGALMDREQFDRPSATSFYMHGIDVLASNSTVRGLVINRFLEFTNNLPIIGLRTGGQPLTVSGNGNVIEGVYVGTNVAGTSALANFEPVRITGNNNRLGGKASQQRNLFAAGREGGINISGDNNILQGNFVGTNAAGNAAIPNSSSTPGRAAVSIIGANNRIGGGEPGAGNLISGNNLNGLDVSGPGNVIQGNFIGTNAAGATRLGNSGNGLNIAQSPFLALLPIIVGGTLPFERNIISGNSIGILVNGSDGVIQGNLIGTDITGTLDLGNTLDGIFLNSGDSLLIGGTATGAGNLISGNDRFGILVARSESTGHRIQGNRIGTQADGVSPLGNGSDGIAFGTDFFASTNGIGPVDSLIGGTEAGAGNIIAFNTGRGVNIAAGRRIGILSNAIFSNGQLGIDLNVNGVTSNDSGDADSGDNSLQNFPVLSETITDGTRTSISGTFNSLANTTFVLQLFSNAVADATGFGEGQTLLASRSVTTDGAGNASFTIVVNIAVPVGQFIAATATDGANNTSEFSLAKAIVAGTVEVTNGPPAPLAGGPYTINEGSSLTVDASTSSDPDGDQLSFSWDINGDGTFGDAVGTTPTLTWTQLQALGIVNGPSSFDVQVRADDAAGHVVTSSVAKLDILNVKPVVNAGPSTRNVLEAVQVDLSGTFTDPGTADTHTLGWHVAASNGQVIADGTGASFSFIPLDNGTYTVTIMVTDSDQESGTAVVTVIIANADPIASIIGQPASGTVGVPIQLSSSVSDPSPVDVAAGLRIQWFADLTPEYNVEFTADTPDFSFTPTEPGIWDVALIVKDKDNGRRVVQFFLDVLPAPSGMAPGVSLAPDASLNEGSNFTSSGSFTDPDSGDTWTATVNYGDGSGDQPLTLNADKTFDLTHFYADNGTFDIVVTVTDSSNRFGVETTHVTVKNLSPSAEAIDGQTVKEGDLVNLLGSFSDPGTADTHTFNWHVVASNGQLVADGSAQNFQFVPNDNGTYTVTFQVTDDDGESGSDSLLITVNNVAPTANAGPDQTIDEGTLVTLIGNFTDPGSADTHTFNWHVVASNGQLISDGSGQNFQFGPLDNGIYTVTFTVTDDDGLAGTDSVVITVMAPEKNVPPQIVSFSSGDNCTCTSASRSVTVSGEFTDRDLLDHHTVIIDWGDGTTSSGLITEAGGTGAVTASHQYSQGGIYVVTLRLSDDDSTVSAQTNALVVGARVHNGVLEIVGTKQDDRVKINTVGSRSYRVDASFFEGKSFRHFPSTGVTRIVVMLCDGNDFAHIGSNIQVPALLDGGNGKDNLKGAGGPDVLLGRDGDDVLDGGGNCGRDLLIGGRGADRLIGNAGDDLLIAGTTRFDNYVAALDAIMAEWTSKLDYAVRVANLGGAGSGPAFDRRRNGNYFLISSGPNATVFGDGARDQLTGSAGWDWFFATEEDKLTDPMGRVAGRERSDRKK